MSFGFLGIQFGFALQNANVSRIFETLGASIDAIPILWIAAPLTGMVVQPIIGYLSDRTWGRLGRRRPFFFIGAILASVGLLIMPNSPALWVAAGMLWIMDTSFNITMEPFRALVADLLPSEQRTAGFAFQTIFIGVGAFVASWLPYVFTNWFNISNTAPAGEVPPSVRYSFYIGAAAFLGSVLYTVFTTKEYPPENIEEFRKFKQENKGVFHGFSEVIKNIAHMPTTMVQLAVVQFFSWFALFAMWIYTTPAVTRHLFFTSDPTTEAYNTGANLVGKLMGVYNLFAAIMAFILPWLSQRTSRKFVHSISLIAGGLGLLSFYFIKNPDLLYLSEIGIGLGWASILTMPYSILAGSIPPTKMGVYMGLFNFFIVIPQIVAASILGLLVKNFFGEDPMYALVVGGCSMFLAALLVMFVKDVDFVKAKLLTRK
ncbi:MAG TPA: MFS transporter [Ignavibacteriaceae bacterium]|nr:MFS transporter [Ignavibacteriaceae bacterium]